MSEPDARGQFFLDWHMVAGTVLGIALCVTGTVKLTMTVPVSSAMTAVSLTEKLYWAFG